MPSWPCRCSALPSRSNRRTSTMSRYRPRSAGDVDVGTSSKRVVGDPLALRRQQLDEVGAALVGALQAGDHLLGADRWANASAVGGVRACGTARCLPVLAVPRPFVAARVASTGSRRPGGGNGRSDAFGTNMTRHGRRAEHVNRASNVTPRSSGRNVRPAVRRGQRVGVSGVPGGTGRWVPGWVPPAWVAARRGLPMVCRAGAAAGRRTGAAAVAAGLVRPFAAGPAPGVR